MKCTTLIAAAAALTLVNETFAGATLSADGKTLTLSAGVGETLTYADLLPATVETIVKTGAGRYDLAPSSSSFTGIIEIREGTLGGNGTKIGEPANWIVADGASLLVTALSGNSWSAKPEGLLEIGGSGVGGGGALQIPSVLRHIMFNGGTKLLSDTLATGGTWGFASLDMGGHDLYVRPTTRFELQGFTLSNPGNIHVLAKAIQFMHSADDPYPDFSGGLLQKYVVLSNSTTAILDSLPASRPVTFGLKVPSGSASIEVGTGNGTASQTSSQSPLTGPVDATGNLTVKTSSFVRDGTSYRRGVNLFGHVSVIGAFGHSGDGFLTFHDGAAHDFSGAFSTQGNGVTTFTNTTYNMFRSTVSIGGGRTEFVDSGSNARTEFRGKVSVSGDGATLVFDDAGDILATAAENVVGGATNAVAPCFSVSGTTVFTVPVQPSFSADAAATNKLAMGKTAGTHGILSIGPGGVVTNDIAVGDSGSGAIHITGGRLFTSFGSGNDGSVGSTYGFIGITNGTFETKGFMWIGNWGGRGLLLQSGGKVAFTAGPAKLGRSGAKALGSCYVSGGTFDVGSSSIQFLNNSNPAAGSEAHLTVDGDGALVRTKEVNVMARSGSGASEFVNLNNGGVIEAEKIRRNYGDDATAFYVNFDGGVFRARANGDVFQAASFRPTRVTVHGGGAVIDTQGYAVTWSAPLLCPGGGGIASIALPADIANVPSIGPGAVRISSSGGGTGASAVMDYDMAARQPTRIIVTSPGCGYDAGTTTVTVEDSSLNTYSATFSVAENVTTGGLVKRGSGTLTLSAANTYGGATRVEGGTVAFADASGYPGGDLEVPAAALQSAPAAPLVQAQSLAFSSGRGIRLTEADTLDASSFGASVTIATSETPLTSVPALTLVDSDGTVRADSGPWSMTLADGGRILKVGVQHATMVIMR